MNASDREKRVALVTGASSGIGLELGRQAAADGFNLVLVARNRDALDTLARELREAHGVEARVLAKDLADPGAPSEIFAELARAGVTVDVLVNSAGIGTWGRYAELDPEGELRQIRVNVVALAHLTRLFLPEMVRRGAGRVLNVASTAAFQPGPLMATYYASKAYVLSFSEALAEELAGTGVTVTVLCPGPTSTNFQRRAKMENVRIASGTLAMHSSSSVARAGWRGMMRGKRVVIPGVINWLLVESVRLGPRRLVAAIAHRMNAHPS
ncbi:MAG TPA: SDR family oxidoreductase [Thermoanaerobaculaceae bacterium]|nr:SDR family oxidoreductase [Thermoanaerobaculaceae bacterium]